MQAFYYLQVAALKGVGSTPRKQNPVLQEYEALAKNLLKGELKRRGVTYAQLAEKLGEIGVQESEQNLNKKISRGGLQCSLSTSVLKGCWLLVLAIGGLAHAQDKPTVLYNDAVLVCDETGCRERSPNRAQNIRAEEGPAGETNNDKGMGQNWSVIQFGAHSSLEQPEKKEETERAIRDVKAQEAMVLWAGISSGVAFFALVGLFLTLRETRRIGEAETRGYITTTGFHLLASDADGKPIVEITIVNSGQTPVYEVRIAAMIATGSKNGDRSPQRIPLVIGKLVIDPFSSATVLGQGSQAISAKYGAWPYPERASRVASQTTFLHYIGLIFYRDIFDSLWEQDIYYLLYWADGGDLEARNFTLNSKPRQIKNYPSAKKF